MKDFIKLLCGIGFPKGNISQHGVLKYDRQLLCLKNVLIIELGRDGLHRHSVVLHGHGLSVGAVKPGDQVE